MVLTVVIFTMCVSFQVTAEMNEDIVHTLLYESQTVTSVDDINQSGSIVIPTKNIQSSGHIRGWIDIVGFEDTVMIGNISYTNSTGSPNPIVQSGASGGGFGFNDNLDWIRIEDEQITTTDNITTAEIDIKLKWHRSTSRSRSICVLGRCRTVSWIQKDYYFDTATFSASEPTPLPYPDPLITVINVSVYNTSIRPKSMIYLPELANTLGYRIEFNNESVEYYYNELEVETQSNGFKFGNTTDVDLQSIYEDSDTFSRTGSNIIVNSTDMEKLSLYIITPYEELPVNYTVTNISDEMRIEPEHAAGMFNVFVLSMFITFLVKHYRKF